MNEEKQRTLLNKVIWDFMENGDRHAEFDFESMDEEEFFAKFKEAIEEVEARFYD